MLCAVVLPADIHHLLQLASVASPPGPSPALQAAASAAAGVVALRRLRRQRDLGLLSESEYRRRCRALGLDRASGVPPLH